jgi:hypothetical protein
MPNNKANGGETESHVYIKDADNGWVPAVQRKVQGDQATVAIPIFKTEHELISSGGKMQYSDDQVIDLSQYPNKFLPMQNLGSNEKLEDYKDMVALPFLHEVRRWIHGPIRVMWRRICSVKLTRSPFVYLFLYHTYYRLPFFITLSFVT